MNFDNNQNSQQGNLTNQNGYYNQPQMAYGQNNYYAPPPYQQNIYLQQPTYPTNNQSAPSYAQQNQFNQQENKEDGIYCPKCGSHNVQITIEQISSKTKGKGMGCLYKIGRAFMIFITCGLWLLFGERNKTEKTKYKTRTVGICQRCGHKFIIKQ